MSYVSHHERPRTDRARPGHAGLHLLNGYAVQRGGKLRDIAASGQRLLAFLAIQGPSSRALVAGTLWPDTPERRAGASLRTTIWRLKQRDRGLITTHGGQLALSREVLVDLDVLRDRLRRLIAGPPEVGEDDLDVAAVIGAELLPGWYEDWVLSEREVLRQLQLHALEALARLLTERARYTEALEAALEAVRLEPLRESASRVLIAVHLAEDNFAEAVRHYRTFRQLLRTELQAEPSERIAAMVGDHLDPATPAPGSSRATAGGKSRTHPPLPVRRS